MRKPKNNEEARMRIDEDYYGKKSGKLSLLRKVSKDEMEWDYYDPCKEKYILLNNEIVGVHKF